MPIHFVGLETLLVRGLQAGGPDANGQTPERHVSPGRGVPCRHCLRPVAAGEPFLLLSHRPFPSPQPYAEQGPIFLHADACARHLPSAELPAMLASERYLVRGYGGRRPHRLRLGPDRADGPNRRRRRGDVCRSAPRLHSYPLRCEQLLPVPAGARTLRGSPSWPCRPRRLPAKASPWPALGRPR